MMVENGHGHYAAKLAVVVESNSDFVAEFQAWQQVLPTVNLLSRRQWHAQCDEAAALVFGYKPTQNPWEGVDRISIEPRVETRDEEEKKELQQEIKEGKQLFSQSLQAYSEVAILRLKSKRDKIMNDHWAERDDVIAYALGGSELGGVEKDFTKRMPKNGYFYNFFFEVPEIIHYLIDTYTPSKNGELPQVPLPAALTLTYLHDQVGSGSELVELQYSHVWDAHQGTRKGLSSTTGSCPASNEEIFAAVERVATIFYVFRPLVHEYFNQLEMTLIE